MTTQYLLDFEFLKQLDILQQKEIFARVTSLTFDELPVEQIEGRVTAGSVNIDGNSAIRRSCSLTLMSENLDINEWQWGIKTKFRLEIGLHNTINPQYPDICWFPLGLYVITSFTTSISNSSSSISIQGKDKMCLLNGDLGGNLPASIDFGKEESYEYRYIYDQVNNNDDLLTPIHYTYDANSKEYKIATNYNSNTQYYIRQQNSLGEDEQFLVYTPLTLASIIKEGVHAWAQEDYGNIIINDLDTFGLEQLTYKGDVPLYLQYNFKTQKITIFSTFPTKTYYMADDTSGAYANIESTEDFEYDVALNGNGTRFALTENGEEVYTLNRIEYGDDIGYRLTDLTYAGDLISSIGETFTSILDKIKNMLGDFEYFYNLDGQFIFQRKKTYTNIAWSAIQNDIVGNKYVDSTTSKIAYDFIDQYLVSAFNNNPALNNLKNDYSVWGERTGVSGAKIPIHVRYSINKKPEYYKALDGEVYATSEEVVNQQSILFPQLDQDTGITCINGFAEEDWQTIMNRVTLYKERLRAFLLNTNKFQDEIDQCFTLAGVPYIKTERYRKQIIDNDFQNLPNAWWDLEDWCTFYELITGKPADKSIFLYHNQDINNTCSLSRYPDAYRYPVYEMYKLNLFNNSFETLYSYTKQPWLIIAGHAITYSNGVPIKKRNSNSVFSFGTFSDTKGKVYQQLPNELKLYGTYPFNTTEAASTYHIYERLTPIQLIDDIVNPTNVLNANKELHFYINYNTSTHKYEKKKIISENNERVVARAYIYNPCIPEIDGSSIEAALIQRAINDLSNIHRKIDLSYHIVDWREIIYQMSQDYFANHANFEKYEDSNLTYSDVFLTRVAENNPGYYPTGKTGYESYYSDIKSFWRDLYNSDIASTITFENGIITSDYYWTEKLKEKLIQDLNIIHTDDIIVNLDTSHENRVYWNKSVFLDPTGLNFWLDFLDTGDIMKYSVSEIGLRTKALNNNKLASVYYKTIPNIIFYPGSDEEIEGWKTITAEQKLDKTGYIFLQIPTNMVDAFSVSSRYNSIKDEIDNLLYQFAYVPENVTLTTLPIYYLQPNTRIQVADKTTGINGEYIMTKITVPLTYNGTMSITANKAPERIY